MYEMKKLHTSVPVWAQKGMIIQKELKYLEQ